MPWPVSALSDVAVVDADPCVVKLDFLLFGNVFVFFSISIELFVSNGMG